MSTILKNNNKQIGFKITIMLYFFVNFICWTLITIGDWFEETTNNNYFMMFCIFILPILLFIAYIYFQICTGDIKEKFWKKFLYKLIWLGVGAIYYLPIHILVFSNYWIIQQSYNGWEDFLNGIEYLIFGLFFIVLNAVAWFLFDVGALIYFYIHNKSIKYIDSANEKKIYNNRMNTKNT